MNFNDEITDPNQGINAKINLLRNIPHHMSDIEIVYEIEDIETALEPDQPPLSEQTIENIRNFLSEMNNQVEIKKNEIQNLMRLLIKKKKLQKLLVDRNSLNNYDPYLPPDINKTIPYFAPIQRSTTLNENNNFQTPQFNQLFNDILTIKDIKNRMIYYIEQYIIYLQTDYNELIGNIKTQQRSILPVNRNNPNSAKGLPSHIKSKYAGNTSGSPLDFIINSNMEEANKINQELHYFYNLLNNLGYNNNMDKQIREATFTQQRKNRKGGKSKKKSYKKSRKLNKTKYRKRKH